MFKVGSIFIPVTDMKKSTDWYVKFLGVKIIDSWEDGAGFYLPAGTTQLALVKVESPQPTEFIIKGEQKNSYFNFVVDDIQAAHQQFRNNGIVTTEIDDFGGMKFFDFFDLDGNPFSVVNEVSNSPFHSDNVRKMQERDKTNK
ncbi:Predicted enzyme related to lactoylglutathione lyase [Niallia circulans]|uniref:VOC family protein n=1 Tax=Niallia circulans TaxID=1397 RepID=UPI00077C3CA1|nr:VOC family protein [Niallia circulans]MDR4316665.1 VOC family protein [Niallia circulans]MED3840342.1 VOC family protein [Niallia circulans]MED4242030.1 VOC family protein [Niallia circulans]MED4249537.1 VOC family protein [Niallia circulans]QKH59248.1 VOC family protein [Niallia circulans]